MILKKLDIDDWIEIGVEEADAIILNADISSLSPIDHIEHLQKQASLVYKKFGIPVLIVDSKNGLVAEGIKDEDLKAMGLMRIKKETA